MTGVFAQIEPAVSHKTLTVPFICAPGSQNHTYAQHQLEELSSRVTLIQNDILPRNGQIHREFDQICVIWNAKAGRINALPNNMTVQQQNEVHAEITNLSFICTFP